MARVLFRTVTLLGDRLSKRVAQRESQIVLGLDPDPMALWPGCYPDASPGASQPGDPAQLVAEAVTVHCQALIDAAGQACVAVKPQLARFEALGSFGWIALEAVVAYARAAGLLVVADGKRGDIDVSARAYAEGLLGEVSTPHGPIAGLGADLLTVNPLMGADAVAPFVEVARRSGAGVLALVRTSNPGAADIEDLPLRGGEPVWERIAALVQRLGCNGVGDSGLSDVGAVVGATVPAHLARARELMPSAVFLLPGVGAQGGRVQDLAPAFVPGRAGGLIAASRSIADAHRQAGGEPASAARAEAERLREQAWRLSEG
ncbi:MAG: orotidine-5'-phosphate decarboxylase [Solirubrobacteraceae bacterium]